jgi:hypothetical protein
MNKQAQRRDRTFIQNPSELSKRGIGTSAATAFALLSSVMSRFPALNRVRFEQSRHFGLRNPYSAAQPDKGDPARGQPGAYRALSQP